MPFKIFDRVVTLHRGTIFEKFVKQPKDELLAQQLVANRPAPAQKSRMPRVEFARVTDRTQHASRQSLQKAVDKAQSFTSENAVARAVDKHLDAALARHRSTSAAKPMVILVGEDHGSKTSLMAEIATIGNLKRAGLTPTVLLEHSTESVDDLMQDEVPQMRRQLQIAEQLSAAGGADLRQGLLDSTGDRNVLAARHAAAKACIAQMAGCEVQAFDTHHEQARNLGHRESGMKEAIQNALDGSTQPVIVFVGTTHLAELHSHFKNENAVIAMSAISMELADLPHVRQAKSYVMASPDVMVFQEGPALEAAPFDFAAFADARGIRAPADTAETSDSDDAITEETGEPSIRRTTLATAEPGQS